MSGSLDTKIKLLLARHEAVNFETKCLSEEIARARREEEQLQLQLRELHKKSYKAIRQEREFWRNQIGNLKKQLVEMNEEREKDSNEKLNSAEELGAEANVELKQLAMKLQKIKINKQIARKKRAEENLRQA